VSDCTDPRRLGRLSNAFCSFVGVSSHSGVRMRVAAARHRGRKLKTSS
jgi:hypothetical protein